MMRDIFCNCLQNLLKIDQQYSMKLFREKDQKDLELETLRLYFKQLKDIKKKEEICNAQVSQTRESSKEKTHRFQR